MPNRAHTTRAASDPPVRRGGIVVGIDGSTASNRALEWATKWTSEFGPIQPVAAYHLPWWVMLMPPPVVSSDPESDLERELSRTVERALSHHPHAEIEPPIVCRGLPGRTLCSVARGAELLVIGTRGRSAMLDATLGSVGVACLKHSPVPIVIVPEAADVARPWHTITVAVDGSPESIAALAWAFRRAPVGGEIVAVRSWTFADMSEDDLERGVERVEREHVERREQQVLDECIELARAQLDTAGEALAAGVTVKSVLELGEPAGVIRGAAAGSDALVLGSPHRRGLAHALIGSVTTTLVHDPDRITVIVPKDWNS